MKSLKTLAKQDIVSRMAFQLDQRLPSYIQGPCQGECEFLVAKERDYYLLHLKVTSNLNVICQRCLNQFMYAYEHQSKLAICPNDDVAERMMSSFDCIVNSGDELDLIDIITDELHLFCPEKHVDSLDCDDIARQYLKSLV